MKLRSDLFAVGTFLVIALISLIAYSSDSPKITRSNHQETLDSLETARERMLNDVLQADYGDDIRRASADITEEAREGVHLQKKRISTLEADSVAGKAQVKRLLSKIEEIKKQVAVVTPSDTTRIDSVNAPNASKRRGLLQRAKDLIKKGD